MAPPLLRPYQSDANEQVAAACRRGCRVVILQSPTGSGKTTNACDLIKKATYKGSSVLTIVHRRRLVDQMSDRLEEFEVDHGVLMRGHRHERSARVQVASRDTLLSRCVQNQFFDLPETQLVVVDEFRHAIADEYRRLLKHYEDRGAYIVGLDATPVDAEGNGLGPWVQALVVAAKVTDLVKQGYLTPVKVYAPDRKVKRGKVQRGIAGDLVGSWQAYAQNLPTVLFTSRVAHSQDAVAAFLAEGIRAVHIDADTPDDVRDRAFDGLEDGSVQVISNVGIVREGWDCPILGCVQFYMNPPGRVAWLQGCGRIMRPYPGKKYGVAIDHSGVVLRDGFPDEDTDWPLSGNVDREYREGHDKGLKPKAFYCSHCCRLYHGEPGCPECGRLPRKPPRSVFAAEAPEQTDELLVEAERGHKDESRREEQVKLWLRCLGVAAARDGTFAQAAMIFKPRYGWPQSDFPCMPSDPSLGWKQKVLDAYPNFGRKARA